MASVPRRLRTALRRLRRLERRELDEFRRWIEDTRNLVHVSILVFVPLLIGLMTSVTNLSPLFTFLLFPPLASGTYTLFAHPESRYADPRRFVGGMTTGAVCGWLALELTARFWYRVPPEAFVVHPGAAAFGILLTAVVTWALDLEEAQAYSTALLVLITGVIQPVYVASIFVSSAMVAGAFVLWRRVFYEQRASYLYRTTHGDDNVLVPMRGETAATVASFGAQLAAAHEAGKVVLFDVVSPDDLDRGLEADGGRGVSLGGRPIDRASMPPAARPVVDRLDATAAEIEARFDLPCEVVVVIGRRNDAVAVLRAARETSCDLIVVPYEAEDGALSSFVRRLFAADIDVIAARLETDRDRWRRIMVPVRRPGDVAHAMLDFAGRLAGPEGRVAIGHCIASERRRRDAEEMLANLAETFERAFETRVSRSPIETFLAENAGSYDLTVVGSSTDRTAASRFVNPPTFRRLHDLDCDVAIVHRG